MKNIITQNNLLPSRSKSMFLAMAFLLSWLIPTQVAHATTCAGAAVIPSAPSLPYTVALTCSGTNDITSANSTACGSGSYKGGQEAVFVWTPAAGYTGVSVAYTGATWTAITFYNGCPTSGGVCLGSIANSASSKTLSGINVSSGVTYYIVIDTWPSPVSACPGSITLNGTINAACTGTPTPGNTLASVNPVCPAAATVLSLQNATSGTGVTYQWYSSPDNITYTLIGGATSSTYSASQVAATWYKCEVTCPGNPVGTSNPVQVTMNSALACYCPTSYSSCSGDGIVNVVLNTLSNPSPGCPGSGNFTYYNPGVASTNLVIGDPYTINITVQSDPNQWSNAWIDFNGNGLLEASETLSPAAVNPGANGTASFNFTVPVTAVAGLTKLRVKGGVDNTFSNADACGANMGSTWGEIEDYDIQLTAPAPCAGIPTPGNTVASSTSACAGASINLSLQNATSGTGVSYQWYESPDGITYTMISGATANTYTTPALTANVYYYCEVTCTGNPPGNSNPVMIQIVPTPVGGTATGPTNGETYQSLSYGVLNYVGSLQWEYSTVSAAGPYSNFTGETNPTMNATFTAAGTYYIRCKAYNTGCSDDYSSIITTVITVDGDNVCDAIPMSLGYNGPYTNVGATTEAGEAAPPAVNCNVQTGWCPSQTISNTVWFSFVAPASGRVSIHTSPGNWDNQLALWSAPNCGDLLTGGGLLLAANDDSASSPFNAYIAPICLTPGQTYYVQLDGYSTTTNAAFGLLLVDEGNTAPAFAGCPSNMTVNTACDGLDAAATWTAPTASDVDNCGTLTVTSSHNPGDIFPIGTTTVTYTVSDGINTPVTCSFDVTVNQIISSSSTQTETACGSYLWNGTTYSASGTYTYGPVPNAVGCDSVATLILTINPLPNVTATDVSGCAGNPITLVGSPAGGTFSPASPYTGPSTTYTYTYTDANGCTNVATANIISSTLPPVSGISVSNVAGNSATVSWFGLPGAAWYEVRWRPVGSPTWTNGTNANVFLSKTLQQLTPGTAYEVQVRAFCSITSPGSWSPSYTFTTLNSCAAPTGIVASSISYSSAVISWSPDPGAIWYTIRYRVAAPVGPWSAGTTSSTTSKMIAGLTPGTLYDVEVSATCAGGSTPWSVPGQFSTLTGCNTPTGLAAINITPTTATLTWGAVTGASWYNIRYRAVGNPSWINSTSTPNSKNIAGLLASTQYEFQVATACGSSFTSTYSPSALFTSGTPKSEGAANLINTNANHVTLYPNPTNEMLNVDLYTESANNTTVKVMDMSGRIVKQVQIISEAGMNHVQISLAEMVNGLYTVQVLENNKLTYTGKVSKQ
ncbi:MAG: fibronectin type III domain-containing protein [Chitinophagaceae bacterium]|nr:fibronectin type III domain-containing protein [Chitinophagaceae bacterium]